MNDVSWFTNRAGLLVPVPGAGWLRSKAIDKSP